MTPKLVGIGELLWDVLPGGSRLGGAPANFTYHARALGAEARVVSRVGNDNLGREARTHLTALGVPVDGVETDASLPTGTVSVEIAADGQPHYQIHEKVAWDALMGEAAGRSGAVAADVVCFGTLAQRQEPSRSTIRSLVAATRPSALRILDINLRQHYFSAGLIEDSLKLANVLKVNDTELARLAAIFQLTGDGRAQIMEIARRYKLRLAACTRGARGSLLLAEGKWSDHPGVQAKVVDTVGAGDAFTAAMALGFLAGWDLDLVNERANRVAAHVCACAGAMPALPEPLRALFRAN
jgi:fructokinase